MISLLSHSNRCFVDILYVDCMECHCCKSIIIYSIVIGSRLGPNFSSDSSCKWFEQPRRYYSKFRNSLIETLGMVVALCALHRYTIEVIETPESLGTIHWWVWRSHPSRFILTSVSPLGQFGYVYSMILFLGWLAQTCSECPPALPIFIVRHSWYALPDTLSLLSGQYTNACLKVHLSAFI